MVLIHFVSRFLLPRGLVDARAQESAELVSRKLQTHDLLRSLQDLGEHWLEPGPDLNALKDLIRRARKLNEFRNGLIHTPPGIANVWEGDSPMQRKVVQFKGRKRKPRDPDPLNDFSVERLQEETDNLQDLINEASVLLTNLAFLVDR